jgi:hypothetical protein
MSIQRTWNNTNYSIPESGETGWMSLTDFLVDLASNAQTTNKQFLATRISTVATTVVSAATDCVVGINYAGAATVNLPAGVANQIFFIGDESGNAATNNITLTPNGTNTINGTSSFVISNNKQKVIIVFYQGDWKLISNTVASGDVPITASSVDTFTNKSLVDNSNYFINNADNTKKIQFQLNGLTTATTRVVSFPDADLTIVGTATTQTLSNKSLVDNSTFVISNADNSKKITFDVSAITTATTRTIAFPDSDTTIVGTDSTQTVSNKSLIDSSTTIINQVDLTKAAKFDTSQITTSTTRTFTLPDTSITLAGRSNAETLQNKSLESSTTFITDNSDATKKLTFNVAGITTGTTRTVTLPDADFTAVGTTTDQTITNKDIDGGTATDTSRITTPKASLSTLNSLTRKEGTILFASDAKRLFVDNGTSLSSIGGATGGASDAIFYENGQTVTANYTITTNTNAMSTGTITINSGVSVTVPSGSRWVIL